MLEVGKPLYLWRVKESGELYPTAVKWIWFILGNYDRFIFDYTDDSGKVLSRSMKLSELDKYNTFGVVSESDDPNHIYPIMLSGLEKTLSQKERAFLKSQKILYNFKVSNREYMGSNMKVLIDITEDHLKKRGSEDESIRLW